MFGKKFLVGVACALSFTSMTAIAEVKLPKLVGSGMVMQRDAAVKIWGWADPGEKVTITFKGADHSTAADQQGNWQVSLPAMKAGGPFEMLVEGENTLRLEDVLIGDVWLASGQSNMELTLTRAEPRFADLVPQINNKNIRQFEVPDRYNFKNEQQDLENGQWQPATQENIRQFSAVGYFFAEAIERNENVPIGIINASLGGSPVEAWLSEDALKKFPEPYEEAKRFRDDALIEEITLSDQTRANAWYEQLHQKDAGFSEGEYLWAQPDLETSEWQTTTVPGYWKDNAVDPSDGVVWFRKTVTIPKKLVKQDALLVFGAVVDADQIFVNGTKVGETTYMYPPRRYAVPADVLQPGENVITVRVTSQQGKGGFVPDKEYALNFAGESIDLSGQWQFKRGATVEPLASQTFIRWKPMGLYNAMIAPLVNYPVKGVIWYQGESNAGKADTYRERFPALIRDWRSKWQQDDLPFLFVQLANYVGPGEARDQIGNWPELREAQAEALTVPNTAMVVSIDVGEWNDIHPLDKQTIGHRLAAAAEHLAYGKDVVYSGPMLDSATRQGRKVLLQFNHSGSGLVAEGGALQGFELAGDDGEFQPATAKIKNNKVVLSSKKLKDPQKVRYAWSNNPEAANLFNKEGFPASPFRADLADENNKNDK